MLPSIATFQEEDAQVDHMRDGNERGTHGKA